MTSSGVLKPIDDETAHSGRHRDLAGVRDEMKKAENDARTSKKKLEVQITDCANENNALRRL
ncbi:unnamed protein product [Dibothriocephalus latus]|uniref:Uncharacterized protein n=1 Tax=Dibothriocephalus latus TaxID=60516 RepID=A0A3P7MXG9_DIBLA|nr:unnamed protein product [Dibothriocephalus latus]